ncbi:MAG: methyltransferase [Vulcanimicrobiaceae bacterium]
MSNEAHHAEAGSHPSPAAIIDMMSAYEQTEALAAAIELGIFDAIGAGAGTLDDLSARCNASARGLRILCDYLTVRGLLTKREKAYGLSPDAAVFLDRRSPACLASAIDFLGSRYVRERTATLAAAVRTGTAPLAGVLEPEATTWVLFAQAMAPLMALPASLLAALPETAGARRVLDIAAGHGEWGIALARAHPEAHVVFVDWPNVVRVALARATEAGLAERVSVLAGSAFEVAFGTEYDLVLLPNFLHHFDPSTCETLLRKVYAALRPGGHAIAAEFVPNPDRVSPPSPASFSLKMLVNTPRGDAYTFAEFEAMFGNAGFAAIRRETLGPTPATAIIAAKPA